MLESQCAIAIGTGCYNRVLAGSESGWRMAQLPRGFQQDSCSFPPRLACDARISTCGNFERYSTDEEDA